MIITADSSILLRLILRDDYEQFQAVTRLLSRCNLIVIPTHVFREIAWVLSSRYKFSRDAILNEIENLTRVDKVRFRADEVKAGLNLLEKNGGFSDGVIAYTGNLIAKEKTVFASFDRKAVRLLNEQGIAALIPE